MENEKPCTIEKFQAINLEERLGGEQLIIDYRVISPTEYNVMTLGKGPMFNKNEKNDDIKIRFFKLTSIEDTRYDVAEYITPESISRVAKLFT